MSIRAAAETVAIPVLSQPTSFTEKFSYSKMLGISVASSISFAIFGWQGAIVAAGLRAGAEGTKRLWEWLQPLPIPKTEAIPASSIQASPAKIETQLQCEVSADLSRKEKISVSLPEETVLSNTCSLQNPLKLIPKYESLFARAIAWILSCFGRAFRVEESGRCYYLDTHSFLRLLCDMPTYSASLQLLKKSNQLNNLVLETINPVIGEKITEGKLQRVFQDFRASFQLHQGKSPIAAVKECLERLKTRHLEIVPYNYSEITKKLKVGDILFRKIPDETFNIVVFGQKIFQPFSGSKREREAYKYSHMAIYLGDGKIAEAAPHSSGYEVRVISLTDSLFALPKGQKEQYLVSRYQNELLAQEAAQIAASLASRTIDSGKKTFFKYDKWQAFRSVWHSRSFGPFARYRYLKEHIDDKKEGQAKDFIDVKSFFCSCFVGFSFQKAESRRLAPKIFARMDTQTQLSRYQIWKGLSKGVKLQFDAERITPQGFRNFITCNPEEWRDVYLLQAPNH